MESFNDGETIDLNDPKAVGRLGEEIAVRYLLARGWKVLARNYRSRYGEADVVCHDGEATVFVEVKTRRGTDTFPEEHVDRPKFERYRRMCLKYLADHDEEEVVRFDVVAVNLGRDGKARVHYLGGLGRWDG